MRKVSFLQETQQPIPISTNKPTQNNQNHFESFDMDDKNHKTLLNNELLAYIDQSLKNSIGNFGNNNNNNGVNTIPLLTSVIPISFHSKIHFYS